MKITVIKKAEVKKAAGHACPWIVEDMAPTKR
jgi:hypothetical protein